VLTKADKLKRGEMAKARQAITKKLGLVSPPLLTSVLTGQGIVELKAEIAKRLNERRRTAARTQNNYSCRPNPSPVSYLLKS